MTHSQLRLLEEILNEPECSCGQIQKNYNVHICKNICPLVNRCKSDGINSSVHRTFLSDDGKKKIILNIVKIEKLKEILK